MKRQKSSDIQDALEKQYKSVLLLIKLTAGLSVEIKELSAVVEKQNALIKQIVSNTKLEEDPV